MNKSEIIYPTKPRSQISVAKTVAVNLTLITTLLIGVFTLVNYTRERTSKMQELQEHLASTTVFLAASLAPALWDLNDRQIIQTIESEMGDREVYGVTVEDISTQTSISLARDKDWKIVAERPLTMTGESLLTMQAPVLHLNKQIGSVKVYITPQFAQTSLNHSLLIICLGTLALIICQSSILYFSLRRTILLPLALISDYARQVRSGNYDGSITPLAHFTGELRVVKRSIEDMVSVLLASEAKYRTIFESAVEGFFQTTPGGRLLSANPALAEFFGYDSPEEMLRTGADISTAYVRNEDRERLIAELAKEERILGFETQLRRKDKSSFWVTISCRMVRDQDGNALYLEGALLDVSMRKKAEKRLKQAYTEMESQVIERTADLKDTVAKLETEVAVRKKTEEDLVRALEAAETATRAKSDFLANMSHEIRTPLNAILGFTQLLLRDSHTGPDQRRSLETVYRSGEHLLTLLNAILEMSKIEAGRISLDIENFDLNLLLEDLEAMFRVLAIEKGLSLEISMDPALPRWVRGDEQKLHQVLSNLLGNAVKFTDAGGVLLRVRPHSPDGQSVAEHGVQPEDSLYRLLFEVEDTGPGIPENARQSIFSHFEQLTPGNRLKGGTGLGLAIAKAYVEAMGGSIEVVSRAGGGSVFRFALALPAGEAVGTKDHLKAYRTLRLKPGQGEVRILVVDDNEANREILVRLLQEAAFDVREASGGQQACALFESWRPHLVLLDMVMPDMDGFEVLRRIRTSESGAATPVIAVSASVLMEEKERVLSLGACAFLKKPFKAEELYDLLRRHLSVAFQDIGEAESLEGNGSLQDQDHQDSESIGITGLPSELADALREAALSLDVERLRELLALIAHEDASLSKRLLKLVENYQFEKLQEIIARQ